jgi:hypothetical protein
VITPVVRQGIRGTVRSTTIICSSGTIAQLLRRRLAFGHGDALSLLTARLPAQRSARGRAHRDGEQIVLIGYGTYGKSGR